MKITPRYEYPDIERVTNPDGTRFYTCPDTQVPLASVTTILSATADKSFLIEWRKRIGDAEADRQSNYGKNLGSLVHENIENHIMEIPRPAGNAPLRVLARQMSQKIIDNCLPRVDELWGIERPLFFPGLFAGTVDAMGVYDGKEAIMDHKNAKKMRKREDITDYFHQLSAYAIAHNARYGTNINRGVIFMVDRTLVQHTYVIEGDEFLDAQGKFLDRVGGYLEAQNA